ncbi:MAG: helix-hairpin-helix domain-containing protein [Thermoleophilia bacterium]
MPSISRQQLIAWSAVGLVILLIGANYLRSQVTSRSPAQASVVTVGLNEAHPVPIKVHVAGAVAQPGLYEFTAGDRVADALQRAGGALPEADLTQINLAAKLADGQQVVVPLQGAAATAGTASGSGAPGGAGQPVNLNSATLEQLQQLDGIGPKTAQKILDYREAHGGFKSPAELLDVPGIGPSKFEQIKSQVCV